MDFGSLPTSQSIHWSPIKGFFYTLKMENPPGHPGMRTGISRPESSFLVDRKFRIPGGHEDFVQPDRLSEHCVDHELQAQDNYSYLHFYA